MGKAIFCQSCGMPLRDTELKGTEQDGSASNDYCKYCYQQGEFTHPGMSFGEMSTWVVEKMEEQNIPEDIIETTLLRLPFLKRWKGQFLSVEK